MTLLSFFVGLCNYSWHKPKLKLTLSTKQHPTEILTSPTYFADERVSAISFIIKLLLLWWLLCFSCCAFTVIVFNKFQVQLSAIKCKKLRSKLRSAELRQQMSVVCRSLAILMGCSFCLALLLTLFIFSLYPTKLESSSPVQWLFILYIVFVFCFLDVGAKVLLTRSATNAISFLANYEFHKFSELYLLFYLPLVWRCCVFPLPIAGFESLSLFICSSVLSFNFSEINLDYLWVK